MITSKPAAVGLVGVGAMGFPIGRRLVQAGFEVFASDSSADRVAMVSGAGMQTASTPEVLQLPHSIIFVANGDQLLNVSQEFLGLNLSAQATWIVMGTIDPEELIAAQALVREAGVTLVDAPVTGGVAGAISGKLKIFTACDEAVFQSVHPILQHCGEPIHVGQTVGQGQAVKAINQVLCSINLVAAAEAIALAKYAGLDAAAVLQWISAGAAGSWMLSDRGPRMVQQSGDVQSAISIFVKDSSIALSFAERKGVTLPVLAAAREQFMRAAKLGFADLDDSRVLDIY